MTEPVKSPQTSLETMIAEIRRDLQDASRDLASLTRIIRDGNGRPPLTERVALLERTVGDVNLTLQDVRGALKSTMTEDNKGRWGLVGIIIAGLLSLAATVLSALLLLNKP